MSEYHVCFALLCMYYFMFICCCVTQVVDLYFYTALAGAAAAPPASHRNCLCVVHMCDTSRCCETPRRGRYSSGTTACGSDTRLGCDQLLVAREPLFGVLQDMLSSLVASGCPLL